jgi:hypothetical protein
MAAVALATALGTAFVALPQTACAFTVLQVDLYDLVQSADVVAYGVVERTTVIDRRKEGRSIWTEFTLRVTEVWKGDAKKVGPRFTWRHVGGTGQDGITVAVPGMPTFVQGEEVVVILEKTSEGHVISAGPQGKFFVRTDKLGRKTVTRDLLDVHLLHRDTQTGKVSEAPTTTQVTRFLKDFRAEVLGHVAAQAKVAVKPAAPVKVSPPGPIGK